MASQHGRRRKKQHQRTAPPPALVCGTTLAAPFDVDVLELLRLQRISHPKRKPTPSVVDKHKRWLRSLVAKKAELAAEREALEREAAERRKRFMDSQARFRTAVVAGTFNDEADAGHEHLQPGAELADTQPKHPQQQQQQQKKPPSKPAAKPAWARSEAEDAELTEAEAQQLLDFVDGLDFEADDAGMNEAAALTGVQSRLSHLDKELRNTSAVEKARAAALASAEEEWELESVWFDDEDQARVAMEDWEDDGWQVRGEAAHGEGKEDEDSKAAGVRVVRRRRKPAAKAGQSAAKASTTSKQDGQDDSASVAHSMLSTASAASSVKQVHSKASLAAMVRKEADARAAWRASHDQGMPAVPEDGAASAEDAHLVSKLPYRYMNPSL